MDLLQLVFVTQVDLQPWDFEEVQAGGQAAPVYMIFVLESVVIDVALLLKADTTDTLLQCLSGAFFWYK